MEPVTTSELTRLPYRRISGDPDDSLHLLHPLDASHRSCPILFSSSPASLSDSLIRLCTAFTTLRLTHSIPLPLARMGDQNPSSHFVGWVLVGRNDRGLDTR